MEKKKSLPGTYLCSICSNTFFSRCNLTRHMRNVHNKNIGVLECCGVRFSDKFALKSHSKICHHPNFECSVCEKRFSSANKLQRHLLIHSEYKEFKCNLCEFATAYKCNLIAHLNSKKHGNVSGEERHVAAELTLKNKCKICCKGYRWTFSLRRHMERSHGVKAKNKLKRNSCDYSTAWENRLKRSLKAHESEANAFGDSMRRSTEMNCNNASDSSRDALTEVGTFAVRHQLRCLHTMSKNTESPVDKKKCYIRKIEVSKEKAPSETSDSGCEESCYPLTQLTTNNLGNVDEVENNATIPISSVEHTSPQRLSAYQSLPLPPLNPIHGEARKLRTQISLVTSIPAVLSILERLLELSATITKQIRSSDGEFSSQTIECFEYLWNTSKMAVCRWEDMEGSMNRNTNLTAVKYAYEILPVFFSLKINAHLEMVECVNELVINTVKNCQHH